MRPVVVLLLCMSLLDELGVSDTITREEEGVGSGRGIDACFGDCVLQSKVRHLSKSERLDDHERGVHWVRLCEEEVQFSMSTFPCSSQAVGELYQRPSQLNSSDQICSTVFNRLGAEHECW